MENIADQFFELVEKDRAALGVVIVDRFGDIDLGHYAALVGVSAETIEVAVGDGRIAVLQGKLAQAGYLQPLLAAKLVVELEKDLGLPGGLALSGRTGMINVSHYAKRLGASSYVMAKCCGAILELE